MLFIYETTKCKMICSTITFNQTRKAYLIQYIYSAGKKVNAFLSVKSECPMLFNTHSFSGVKCPMYYMNI